jgi:hypothetical protein
MKELPKQHKRERLVRQAELEVDEAVSGVILKYRLTYAEVWRILNSIEATWIRYAIRDERHPGEPTEPGGLE